MRLGRGSCVKMCSADGVLDIHLQCTAHSDATIDEPVDIALELVDQRCVAFSVLDLLEIRDRTST